MNAPMTQPELTDDPEANKLIIKIGRHMVARDMIRRRIQELERHVEYRNRKIRELSKQRSEVLNFKLPFPNENPNPQ